MYEKVFQLEIVTPGRVVFKDEATSVSVPGVEGGLQVLYDHAPFLSALEIGEIKVKDKAGKDTIYATSGGFVEVHRNHVVVLVDSAERVSEISIDRARAAKERAEERLHAKRQLIDEGRARAALARALNRLRLSQKV